MSKQMLRAAAAMMLVAALVGCGGGQKQEAQAPAEQPFVAQVLPMDSMTVASVAKMGPYNEAGKAITEVVEWAKEAKVTPVSGPFVIMMDDPTKVKPESTRYEAVLPVPAGTKAEKKAAATIKTLPPMQVAWTEYVGPYDKVGPVYGKLATWVSENKYEMTGPMVEFYLNDPSTTPAESLKTRVGFVVKPMPAAPAESGAAAPAETTKPAGGK